MAGKILVTGGSGQLATALATLGGPDIRLIGRPELDFDNLAAIPATLAAIAPRWIVNAAAYTAVDKAESEPEAAARANHLGPELLSQYAAQAGIPLIHVSTDYVFDGAKGRSLHRSGRAEPHRGLRRHQARRRARRAGHRRPGGDPAHLLVYGATGKNFMLTMLGAARRMPKLRVVADQIGCPTNVDDLARAILAIVARIETDGWQPSFGGVFHAAGTGATSWHGFAVAILTAAVPYGSPMPEIEPIRTEDWPTPAKRPADSRLDCTRLTKIFDFEMPRMATKSHKSH